MAHTVLGTPLADQIERHVTVGAEYLAKNYPGDKPTGQPLHTVYTSAANAASGIVHEWGSQASEILSANREFLTSFADEAAIDRVVDLLAQCPIRDLRFDFEDGYQPTGNEFADARKVGAMLTEIPIKGGIRIPGLTPADWRRSIALLEAVVGELDSTDRFVFTIPKFRALAQVDAAVSLCEAFEKAHGVELRFELQIESPQAVIAADGTSTVAAAIHRSMGRCEGLHYGTYDYSAACGIAAEHQSLRNPVAEHAKSVMLAAAAQTGTWVCDGSTQIAPLGDRPESALKLHYELVATAFERGYYQGWDMHPGHLVTRWLANVVFYTNAAAVAAPRLRAYIDRTSDFDEPASAEALGRVLLRGVDCTVLSLSEAGVSHEELVAVVTRTPVGPEVGR